MDDKQPSFDFGLDLLEEVESNIAMQGSEPPAKRFASATEADVEEVIQKGGFLLRR